MPGLLKIILCTLLFLSPLAADEPVKAALYIEQASTKEPFEVALQLKLDDKWHAYWKNPGDAGMAPQVDWTLPEGYTVLDVQWPSPDRFEMNGNVTFGYAEEVTLIATVQPSDKPADTIKANIRWVVCSDDTCLPGDSDAVVEKSDKVKEVFEKAHARLPKVHPQAQAVKKDDHVHVTLHLPETDTADAFFAPEDLSFDYKNAPQLVRNGDHYEFKVAMTSPVKSLKGVVVVNGVGHAIDTEISTQEIAMRDPITPVAVVVPQEVNSFGMAMILAFVGGMILNLMPCVLPVLSFKILSFVKMAGHSRAVTFKQGLIFSLGVLVSFWVLAGVLLMLQAYGESAGWGFQLQEPIFVGLLAALLLAFGLSLFGVFEMGTGFAAKVGQAQVDSKAEGSLSSFMSGVLATAVATPCTGPFLGSAVGYAVTLPSWMAMLIFTSLGLGMAFPYLLLSAFPKLLKWMPKPGAWMETFKQLMGFLMMATVLWLLWVFAGETDDLALFIVIGSLFVISIGCWIYGRWSSPLYGKVTRGIAFGLTAVCLIIAGVGIKTASDLGSAATTTVAVNEGWEKFSPERVAELQKQGIPVFIDFTAKWCLICQVNHAVLVGTEVEEQMAQKGVVRMKADWTKNDPVITEQLKKFGRNSVPLYVLYDENGKPEVLPQVLTPEVVKDHVKKVSSANVALR